MKKSELVLAMKEKNDTFSVEILSKAVDIVFDEISSALTNCCKKCCSF